MEGFKMGFMNSEGKIEEIPKEYQEIIEHREQLWIDRFKEIEDKCGVVLDQLALTEKAFELACLSLRGKCDYCKYKDNEICPSDHHCSNLVMEYFLEQAKEMMKSE